jgi:hypothetical protein
MSNNTIDAQRLRIALDGSSTGEGKLQGSSTVPFFWKGFDATLELAFVLGTTIQDISKLTAVYLEIKATVDGAALITKTQTSLDNTLASATWADLTKQHCKFELSAAELNIALDTGAAEKQLYAIVYGVTNDEPSKNVPLGFFKPTLKLFGAQIAGTPPDPDSIYQTAEQIAALIGAKILFPAGVNAVRFNLDGTFDLVNIT